MDKATMIETIAEDQNLSTVDFRDFYRVLSVVCCSVEGAVPGVLPHTLPVVGQVYDVVHSNIIHPNHVKVAPQGSTDQKTYTGGPRWWFRVKTFAPIAAEEVT